LTDFRQNDAFLPQLRRAAQSFALVRLGFWISTGNLERTIPFMEADQKL
jgi:hypothetical protein